MNIRWFYSKTVRHATAMRKHVWRLLRAQQDILSPQAIEAINAAFAEMTTALKFGASREELEKQMNKLEAAANKWLKPYPHPVWRENVEVALVALVIAIGIRTFFVQPFKIPTGSMQPTLFGVTHENLIGRDDVQDPGLLKGLYDFWVYGISYKHVVAKNSGALEAYQREPTRFLLFNLKQTFQLGGQPYTVWFPPDKLLERAGLVYPTGERNPKVFSPGEDLIKLRAFAGDHLFVDRLSYNFRHPHRGEIIVFETHGIHGTTPDTYYIKRLVALPGERVQIGVDHHLIINGNRLDSSSPGFENVYSFEPNSPPRDSHYWGHVNQKTVEEHRIYNPLAPRFADETSVYEVKSKHFLVMGDNTLNSADSRAWGDFPQDKVMGKSFFVYWPISKRFGLGYR